MNYYFFRSLSPGIFKSILRMVFCSKNIFLEIKTLKSFNFRTINSSTRKYNLGYCIQCLKKKINFNFIFQNLNSWNWRHFERISEWGHADDCASSKRFLQQQVGKDFPMCNREFDPSLIDRWWYPSNKIYDLHTV